MSPGKAAAGWVIDSYVLAGGGMICGSLKKQKQQKNNNYNDTILVAAVMFEISRQVLTCSL